MLSEKSPQSQKVTYYIFLNMIKELKQKIEDHFQKLSDGTGIGRSGCIYICKDNMEYLCEDENIQHLDCQYPVHDIW